MSKTFKCHCCHRLHKRNFRNKGIQKYCGLPECQQARKNKWEREKLQNDPAYKAKRQEDKKKWRKKYPADKYQKEYRETHPGYCKENRRKQVLRNRKRQTPPPQKIVKTDALNPESVTTQELYVLLPYEKPSNKTDTKKIVKTDALIVQIVSAPVIEDVFSPNTS